MLKARKSSTILKVEQIFGNGVGKTSSGKTGGREVTLQDLRIIIKDGH